MFRLRRPSLRTTVALLLAAAFVVMSALYYYQADISRRALLHEITTQLLHDMRLMRAHCQLLIKDARELLVDTAYEAAPLAGEAACNQWLARQLKHNPGSGEFGVALPSGTVICASDRRLLGVSLAERGYFQQALAAQGTVITRLVNDSHIGKSVMVAAITVRDGASDTPRAVNFFALDIGRTVQQFLRDQPYGGRLLLQDDQGNVLARYPDAENFAGTNRASSPLFQTLRVRGEEGMFELDGPDGKPHVYIFTTLHDGTFGKLYLIHAISKQEAQAPAQKPFYISLALGAAALALFMLAAYVGGDRFFVRRIAQLNRAVDRLAKGDLTARTGSSDADDEIGRLTQSFDDMAATIHRKDAEINRVARALRVVSSGNRSMLHATNETQLYEEMCRAVVTTGGYHVACVGILDGAHGGKLRVVGFNGPDQKLVSDWQKVWDENHPDGITRDAMRKREAVVARHIFSPGTSPWRRVIAERYGYESIAALPLIADEKSIGVLLIGARQPDAFEEEELSPLRELAGDLSYGIVHLQTRRDRDRIAYEHRHHEEILRQALTQTVQTIAATVEMRDPYTAGHQRRVAQLASAIASAMGLPEDTVAGVRFAAILHDVGKITIPAEILAKPIALSDIEKMLVRTHPKSGHDILKDVKFPWPIAEIILQHHERLDGSGYPGGLKGDQILLESRILAVADTVEAMMSHRPYRASLGPDAALAQIRKDSGVKLDREACDACLALFEEQRFSFDA